ncbi:MAG: disulfide bond formation protein B [Beijerinckiaceae bacterium]|nr:disulfide bond formation protein B [Beijerinckiaceae bacterium]
MTANTAAKPARRASGVSAATAGQLAAALAAATITGAWVFEYFGFAPCELCLQQRWAYYIGVPLAVVAAVASAVRPRAGAWLLALVGLVFIGSAIFGAWHAGVEWGFWPGPAGCTGPAAQKATDMNDFLRQMQGTKLVRCDEVAIRIFGLSLAGWNGVVSLVIAAIALLGARNARRT